MAVKLKLDRRQEPTGHGIMVMFWTLLVMGNDLRIQLGDYNVGGGMG